MNESAVRLAIVGCGHIAKKHLSTISRLDGLEVAAVADLNASSAQHLGEEWGVPWFTRHETLLAKVPCDAVCVLTPSGSHAGIAMDAARAGRHLIIEKPATLLPEDLLEMDRLCTERGVELIEVKQYRYHAPVVRLREALANGRLGEVKIASCRLRWCRPQRYYGNSWRGTWAMDGGVFANQTLHLLDLLVWLVGPVRSVQAKAETFMAGIEAEDTGMALLTFESGALGVVEATTCARPADLEASISVLGPGGAIEIGGLAANQLKTWRFESEVAEDEEILREHSSAQAAQNKEGHLRFYEDVRRKLGGLDDSGTVLAGASDALSTIRLLHAIYRAIELGREVDLGDDPRSCRLGVQVEVAS